MLRPALQECPADFAAGTAAAWRGDGRLRALVGGALRRCSENNGELLYMTCRYRYRCSGFGHMYTYTILIINQYYITIFSSHTISKWGFSINGGIAY